MEMIVTRQDNSSLIEALRDYLNSNAHWQNRDSFADELSEFDTKSGYKNAFTRNSVQDILSRKKNTSVKRAASIIEFLAFNGIEYDNEAEKFSGTSRNTKKLNNIYDGKYQLLYDLGRTDLTSGDKFISTRNIELENSLRHSGGIKGSFVSYTEDRSASEISSQGNLIIETATRNSDMMLMKAIDPTRSTPSIVFMVRYARVRDLPIFFGIGMGYQFEVTNSMSATRILGLPNSLLATEKLRRIFSSDIGEETYKLISGYLNGENLNDTNSVLNAGPEFKTQYGIKSDLSMLVPAIIASSQNFQATR